MKLQYSYLYPVVAHYKLQMKVLNLIFRTGDSLALNSTAEGEKKFDAKVDDLHPTEDGEAGEEPHGAPDELPPLSPLYLFLSHQTSL